MYNANSVSISTIVYYYFMHLRTADKTVAPGAEDDPIYYPTRAIVDRVVCSSEGDKIDCCLYKAWKSYLITQPPCKSKFMLGSSPFTPDVTLRVSGR